VTSYFYLLRTPKLTDKNAASIAVLPFADLSQNQDQQYFIYGLTEQLINDLARVPDLKVVGRSSSFQFKGKNEELRTVGRTLGVASVLEGSVSREGDRVRIRAELVKTEDGFQLWSETYDSKIDDIFAVQDEIARTATGALQLKSSQTLRPTKELPMPRRTRLTSVHNTSPPRDETRLTWTTLSFMRSGRSSLTRSMRLPGRCARMCSTDWRILGS